MPLRKPETRPARIIPVKALSQYAVSGEGADSYLLNIWPSLVATETGDGGNLSSWTVTGHTLVHSTGSDGGAVDLRIANPDQYAEIVFGPTETHAGDGGYGVTLRGRLNGGAGRNMYRITGSLSRTTIRKYVANIGTEIFGSGVGVFNPWLDGDVLRAEIRGSTITLFKNGLRILTMVDTSLSFGSPGIAMSASISNSTSGIRQWRGGALNGALPLPTRTPSGVNWTKHRG
jgi:hypothetical protein